MISHVMYHVDHMIWASRGCAVVRFRYAIMGKITL